MILYLVRHGQTETNKQGLLLSSKDEPLNSLGLNQVEKGKELLDNVNFDICFVSPFTRTMETANIILNNKTSIIKDNRLRERDFGLLESKEERLYDASFWNYELNKDDYEVESIQDLFQRTKEFYDYLKQNYADKTILIVSHGATIRALHFNIVGYTNKTNFLALKVPNLAIFKYTL